MELRNKPFTFSQAIRLGVGRHLLGSMLLEGELEQPARGLYRISKGDVSEEDQFQMATLRVGEPSAICLVSALAYYGLTDLIPKQTWIMVPAVKRSSYQDLRLLRSRVPSWKIGTKHHGGFAITDIDRTIVDCLCYRTIVGSQTGIKALKLAIQTKKTTLSKVMEMAQKLSVVHRIRPIVEVLV